MKRNKNAHGTRKKDEKPLSKPPYNSLYANVFYYDIG